MRSVGQLLRQPVKTAAGILMVAMAVAVLCLCAGQAMIVSNFEASLDRNFTTMALPTDYYQYTEDSFYVSPTMPEAVSDWMEDLAAENPDIIRTAAAPGLASAYVPEMRQDTHTNYPYNGLSTTYRYRKLTSLPTGAPYCCAILEITLDSVGEIRETGEQRYLICTGTVEALVGLEEGYPDSTGFTIYLTIPLTQTQTVQDLGLETGHRYLVSGMNYYDNDWVLRSIEFDAVEIGEIPIEAFDPDCVTWYTEEEVEKSRTSAFTAVYAVAEYHDYPNSIHFSLTNVTADYFRSVSMTATDYVPLSTTPEAFLNSENGLLWQNYMELLEINTHAYPVIGVDKLTHLADFVRGVSTVTTGRGFTEEELESGANVCLISESLARINGLTVGDTITLNYYAYDEDCGIQEPLAQGNGVINPGASYYTENSVLSPAQEYTIVGLYHQKYDWYTVEDNLYSMSPNTILTPKTSVPVGMQYTNQGLWGALELYNGKMDAFYDLLDEAGHSLLYACYDQGYSFVKENLQNYDEIAGRAMIVGVVVYGVLLVLYLMLFPTRMGDSIHRMGSMGAQWWRKMCHILLTGLGILLPGTILGTAAAVVLWDRVVHTLTAVVVADLELQLDLGVITSISAVQLLLALVLTGIVTLPMTLGKLMNRR